MLLLITVDVDHVHFGGLHIGRWPFINIYFKTLVNTSIFTLINCSMTFLTLITLNTYSIILINRNQSNVLKYLYL